MQRPGNLLIIGLTTLTLLAAVGTAALTISVSRSRLGERDVRQQQIFQIAEAGVNYYRWRLAHYPNDFQDGTATAGPYLHDYQAADSSTIGRFELTITPPPTGSTIATIQSTGYLLSHPNTKRTVVARVGIPSWSRFAVVSNSDLRFGEGTETFGPIHSNGGIRFDGLAHGLVTSAKTCYDDPDHGGATEFGVHTHLGTTDPLPPAGFCFTNPAPASSVPTRADVFAGGRQVQVSTIDFGAVTADLSALLTKANQGGIVLPLSSSYDPTGVGYHITLRADDKVDIQVVKTELTCQYGSGAQWLDVGYCSNNSYQFCNFDSSCGGTGTCILASHGIGNRAGDEITFTYQGVSSLGLALPSNGIIFAKDNVWVEGTINTARITVVAAKEPLSTGTANIYINKDIRYTNTDGSDVVGLIAQKDILAGLFSEDDLRIDAALLAQKGFVGRPLFNFSGPSYRVRPSGSSVPSGGNGENSCDDFRKRSTLTSYGSLGTYQRYGFAWIGNTFSCGGGLSNNSGYCTRNLNFDTSLTFSPPPSFPTTGEYQLISFDEIER